MNNIENMRQAFTRQLLYSQKNNVETALDLEFTEPLSILFYRTAQRIYLLQKTQIELLRQNNELAFAVDKIFQLFSRQLENANISIHTLSLDENQTYSWPQLYLIDKDTLQQKKFLKNHQLSSLMFTRILERQKEEPLKHYIQLGLCEQNFHIDSLPCALTYLKPFPAAITQNITFTNVFQSLIEKKTCRMIPRQLTIKKRTFYPDDMEKIEISDLKLSMLLSQWPKEEKFFAVLCLHLLSDFSTTDEQISIKLIIHLKSWILQGFPKAPIQNDTIAQICTILQACSSHIYGPAISILQNELTTFFSLNKENLWSQPNEPFGTHIKIHKETLIGFCVTHTKKMDILREESKICIASYQVSWSVRLSKNFYKFPTGELRISIPIYTHHCTNKERMFLESIFKAEEMR